MTFEYINVITINTIVILSIKNPIYLFTNRDTAHLNDAEGEKTMWYMSLINARPDDAISQARDDTISRAKDIWGLDYADSSNGLYPSGNQIGRSPFRPDVAAVGTRVFPQAAGGMWRTVVPIVPSIPTGAATPIVTNAQGWAEWLDFTLDEDAFIIIEGVFSTATVPTIREQQLELSGVKLPVQQIEEIYNNGQDLVKGYWEVPAVLSPKSNFHNWVRSSTISANLDEGFGFLGELIAKRSYMIRQLI